MLNAAAGLDMDGSPPAHAVPAGATDTHVHIFSDRFPGSPGGPPPRDDVTIDDFRAVQSRLGLDRAVVVQPNAYRTDNACLLWALEQLGDGARGVAAVAPDTDEAELERLARAGVRGTRLMNMPGGAVGTEHLADIAARIKPFGWSPIVQMPAADLPDHENILAGLPVDYVIDLMGMFLGPVTAIHNVFHVLRRLIDRGNGYVKLAGRYPERLPTNDLLAFDCLATALIGHAPERIMWASNWPHIGIPPDQRPDEAGLLDVLSTWAPDPAVRQTILVDNPARLYGF
jgi:D-galactarolactone isomerase